MNQPASAYFLVNRSDEPETHTLSVLVDNEPGVLARVIGLFSGRGYNIESLTVSETEHETHLSRITIVTMGAPMVIEQIKNQLARLVPVHKVVDLTTSGAAIELLKGIIERRPDSAAAVYNLAAILAERGRAASAREARQAFLRIETTGPHADEVRRVLGLPHPERAARQSPGLQVFYTERVSVGEVTDEIERRLKPMRRIPFDVGDFAGNVYRGDGLRILELDYFVELVEDSAVGVPDRQAWLDRFGPPDRLIRVGGGELAVYRTFALDIADNRIRAVVRFAE